MSQETHASPLAALQRFAIAITVFNILGHTWFGFEQSLAIPLVALLTAYGLETLLELLNARASGRTPRYAGGVKAKVNFLLSAHITGLAVAMLLYSGERLMPVAFAAAVAIGSKYLLRTVVNGRSSHFLNPSNFGITVTLLCFPWVGIAQPYMFTENLSGAGDWIVPAIIVISGSLLNTLLTRRITLILAWLSCFALQAMLRNLVLDTPLVPCLLPMTGVAFILFTFYMVTDPATTPSSVQGQVAFGAAVAAAYGVLLTVHVVFGLFFALTAVCVARGAGLWLLALVRQRQTVLMPAAGALERLGI